MVDASLTRKFGSAAIVLVIAGAAALVWLRAAGRAREAGDFPDGIAMVCADPECAQAFRTTLAEIAAQRKVDPESATPCPRCGGPAVNAEVCGSCGKPFPARSWSGDARSPSCPLCSAPLERVTGSE